MGITGRWLDSLSDAERDRVIQHPDPTYDGGEWWNKERDCGCLVGCVVGRRGSTFTFSFSGVPVFEDYRKDSLWETAGCRFPDLTERFTPQRMWRLVKARAARGNRVVLPAVTEEAAVA